MSKTLDPIVVNPAKKLQTPTFFKRDIEKIVKQILAQQGGGSAGDGLEVIEWDGERNFTEEEFNKLAQNKACVAFVDGDYREYYYIGSTYVDSVVLCRFSVADDGIANGSASYLGINVDGSFEHFYYDFYELENTKLYKHSLVVGDDENLSYPIELISRSNIPVTFSNLENSLVNGISFRAIHNANGPTLYNLFKVEGEYIAIAYDEQNITIAYIAIMSVITDTVTEL